MMELLAKLAAWSMLAFSVLLFLSQVLAREMGYWLGQRHRAARGTSEAEPARVTVRASSETRHRTFGLESH